MATNTPTDRHETDTGGATGSGSSVWLSQVRAFTERCLREVMNSWTMLLTVLALPAGLQLFYGVMWEDMPATMLSSATVGTAVFGAMYICLYIFGYLLAGDLEDRRYEAYRSMPLSPSADLSGRMLAGIALAAVAFVLTILAGVVTGGSFAIRGLASVPIAVLAFLLTCVFWMILAVPFVVYTENERVAEYAVPMIGMLGYMGTGFNGVMVELAPIEGEVLNYLPNTLPTRLLVYHLVPAGDWAEIGVAPPAMPTGPEYVVLMAVYALIAVAVGTVVVNKALYKRGWWP